MPAVEKRELRTRKHITPEQAEFIKANPQMGLAVLATKYSVSITVIRRWKKDLAVQSKSGTRAKNREKGSSNSKNFSWEVAKEIDFILNY